MDSFPRGLIIAAVSATIAILCGGMWLHHEQERHLRQEAEENLLAIAKLKADLIVSWRSERLADAAVLMHSPFVVQGLTQWMADPQPELTDRILVWLRSMKEHYHYHDILVLAPDGSIRLSLSGQSGKIDKDERQGLQRAFQEHGPVFVDLHSDANNPNPQLAVITPLFSVKKETSEPFCAVLLRIAAGEFLYPLVQYWPALSRTAETLLVRRDGEDALFLNDLRHRTDTALNLRIPLSRTDVPAVMAILGKEGVFHGNDYRGVNVLSALKAIPNSPWFMVAKVDRAEILADWHFRSMLIAAFFVSMAALLTTSLGIVWQRNGKAHYRSLYQAEAALRQSEERYRTILMSVGDGVIATDGEGRVELLNPVAQDLTGWHREEVRGKPLEDVFCIVNEDTGSPVENPVRQVMQNGLVVGLANHTLLISRDGSQRPIADSGAPILDDTGAIVGVVLVFRDQTAERAAQKAMQVGNERIMRLFEAASVPMCLIGKEGTLLAFNDRLQRTFGYTQDEIHTVNDWWQRAYPDPDYRQWAIDTWADCVRTAQEQKADIEPREYRITCKNGEERIMVISGTFIGEDILAAFFDITDRKRMEDELRRSRTELHAIYDNSPVMMCALDGDRRIVYANRALVNFVSKSEEELKAGRACGVFGCANALDDPDGCGHGPSCTSCPIRDAIEDTYATGRSHHEVEYCTTLVEQCRRRDVILLGSTALIQAGSRSDARIHYRGTTANAHHRFGHPRVRRSSARTTAAPPRGREPAGRGDSSEKRRHRYPDRDKFEFARTGASQVLSRHRPGHFRTQRSRPPHGSTDSTP